MARLETAAKVARILSVTPETAARLVAEAKRLYGQRMHERFSELRVAERLKRTNPFLLRIRGATLVREWAQYQVQSALFASEEEAVGHLLETIAVLCHPKARKPTFPDDFDFEVREGSTVYGYQVKMSWDCMPMSSRKNLSNTIRRVRAEYAKQKKEFVGYFAPCYGRVKTSSPPGQEYITLASREFWEQVGAGDSDFDVRVGNVCALLCADARASLEADLVPKLIDSLAEAAESLIGDGKGKLDYRKLFRSINK